MKEEMIGVIVYYPHLQYLSRVGGETLSNGISSVISLKVDVSTLRKIEILVRHGYFKNRSEVIRAAIKAKLMKEKLGNVLSN